MQDSRVGTECYRRLMTPLRDSPETMLPERRSSQRYSIALELEWKLYRRKRLIDAGQGTTVDLSSDGVLFEADHKPAAAGFIELRIMWPAKPDDFAPMPLTVTGRVVRVAGTRVAIRIRHHGFSTAASQRPFSELLNAPEGSGPIQKP